MGAKGVRTKDHLLKQDEIEKLKEAAQTLPERAFIFIPLYTGMRVTEILHMTDQWIDYDTDQIRIPTRQKCDCYDCTHRSKDEEPDPNDPDKKIIKKRKMDKQNGWWSPKTEEGIRTIPLLPKLYPVLSETIKEVFKNHKIVMEMAMNRASVRNIINTVAERAKLNRKLFPHLFRGTYAKQLAKSGFDAFYITSIMGWQDISVAMSYIKMFGSEIKTEMEKKMRAF
jgi:integrase